MTKTSLTLQAAAGAVAALAVAALAALPPGAAAQPQSHSHDHGSAESAARTGRSDATLVDGEVRRLDRDNGKLTIRHGEIRHLDMPPMTMVFEAGDPALLQPLKAGDRIRFEVEQRDGKMVVTRIEPAR